MVSLRKTLSCLLLVAGSSTTIAACGGDDGNDGASSSGAGSSADGANAGANASGASGSTSGAAPSALMIKFDPAYSFFIDGADAPKFRVPFWVPGQDVTGSTWTAEPADAVSFQENNDFGPGGTIATILKAGEVTITVDTGEVQGSGKLTVTPATMDEYNLGSARYNNEIMFMFEMPDLSQFMLPDGGFMAPSQEQIMGFRNGIMEQLGNKQLSCNNCHGEQSTLGKQHGPGQVAGWTDEELIAIMSQGMKPPGSMFTLGAVAPFFARLHTWEGSPDELKGLAVYVRSLDPIKQDAMDLFMNLSGAFGGFGIGMIPGGAAPPPPAGATPAPAPPAPAAGDDTAGVDAGVAGP